MPGHDVHLVGSVPLGNAEAVFVAAGAALGRRLRRLPDGETGARATWVGWLAPVFALSPALEPAGDTFRVHEAAPAHRRHRLRPGAAIADFRIDGLGYADFAIESYGIFRRLRDAGQILPGTRFQIDLAPGHSTVRSHVVEELQSAIEPMFDEALGREIERIAAVLPRADLAIQLDVASAVFERLQNRRTGIYGGTKAAMQERFAASLAALGERVPAEIELLFHFCYGDANHRHSVEPTDMGDMVELANRLVSMIGRPIQQIHMPVPRERSDDAYFAPLRGLRLGPETRLCLGLIHLTGGIAGIERRLATARKFWSGFAIATECGFGRRDPATIPALLRLHAAAAELE